MADLIPFRPTEELNIPNALMAHQQMLQAQRQDDAQNALADAVPLLQTDPQNAFATAARKSPQAALQLLPVIKQMDDRKRAEAADRADAFAKAAMTLKGQKEPIIRKALLQSMAPELKSHGISDEQIANFDPSDANLQTIINQAQDVKGLIAQANADRTYEAGRQDHADTLKKQDRDFGLNVAKFNEDRRHHGALEAKEASDGYRLMTAAEKKAAGLPTEAAYQINSKGKIDRVAGNNSVRPVPASALAGIQNNNTAIQKIDRAIALLEKNPDAIGLKTYAGDAITQRIDPNGVETRAAVADIGSQQLHDRSGAAVTISEAPRLQPFVPSVHDNKQTAITKLKNLRKQYEANNEETHAFFSPEAGYMSVPEKGKKSSSGGKQVNAGVIDFNDLPEN